MRENRPSGSEGGAAETKRPSLPLSKGYSGSYASTGASHFSASLGFQLLRAA